MAAHALNGALLDLSASCFRLALGGIPVGSGVTDVWTASLRSDVDGLGGAYVLLTPASVVNGMPQRPRVDRSPSNNIDATMQRLKQALMVVIGAGLPVAVRKDKSQLAILANVEVEAIDRQTISLSVGEALPTPLAIRLA